MSNIYLSSINHIDHQHHVSLLTLCVKRVKQSQTLRSGRFELNLLTWPGRPNTHVWEPSHPHDFSPFFPGCGSGSPSSTTEYAGELGGVDGHGGRHGRARPLALQQGAEGEGVEAQHEVYGMA